VAASEGGDPSGTRGRSPGRPNAVVFLGLGTMCALVLVGGMALGWLVGRHLGSDVAGILVGLAVGVAVAVTATWWEIRNYFRD
jgi:hypothetical protein